MRILYSPFLPYKGKVMSPSLCGERGGGVFIKNKQHTCWYVRIEKYRPREKENVYRRKELA